MFDFEDIRALRGQEEPEYHFPYHLPEYWSGETSIEEAAKYGFFITTEESIGLNSSAINDWGESLRRSKKSQTILYRRHDHGNIKPDECWQIEYTPVRGNSLPRKTRDTLIARWGAVIEELSGFYRISLPIRSVNKAAEVAAWLVGQKNV